jgi:hypothetical protein
MRVGEGQDDQRAGGAEPAGKRRRLPVLLLLAASPLGLGSCSLVVDSDTPQCDTDLDCASRGEQFASAVCERKLCVAPASAVDGEGLQCKAPANNGLATVKYSFAIQLPVSGQAGPAESFRVQACQQLDVDCQHPVAGPFEVPAGSMNDFSLPQGFSGFFQIGSDGTLPALYFLPRPIVADTIGWNPTVISQDVLAQLAAAAGVSLDATSGVVIASVRDCAGAPVEGAMVSASHDQPIRFYIVNNLPVLSAIETSAQGAVGFVNVPATTIAVNGVSRSGRAFAPVSVRVKPGSLSLVEIRP